MQSFENWFSELEILAGKAGHHNLNSENYRDAFDNGDTPEEVVESMDAGEHDEN